MKNNEERSILLSLFIVPIGGLLVLALCYAGYFALYMLVESVFFSDDPTALPAGIIRNSYTMALLALYGILHLKIRKDLIRAILMIGPLTMLMIALILALYLTPVWAAISTVLIAGASIALLYKNKKPWIYYYAVGLSVAAAIYYAWPE